MFPSRNRVPITGDTKEHAEFCNDRRRVVQKNFPGWTFLFNTGVSKKMCNPVTIADKKRPFEGVQYYAILQRSRTRRRNIILSWTSRPWNTEAFQKHEIFHSLQINEETSSFLRLERPSTLRYLQTSDIAKHSLVRRRNQEVKSDQLLKFCGVSRHEECCSNHK